jgi:hypothetical protein
LALLTPSTQAVVVTELMYHPPPDPAGNATDGVAEFLELHNPGTTPLDLSGWAFDRGLTYVFPVGTGLGPGEYRVLARDPAALAARHGITGVLGPYEGALSNEGERLRLLDAQGAERIDFRYGVHGDWPAAATGAGHSLVLRHPASDPDRVRNWKASYWRGGSPGAAEPDDAANAQESSLVSQDAQARYFKGTREPTPGTTAWTTLDFEPDADWLSGRGGFGYSNDAAELAAVRTVLADMPSQYLSVYARYLFTLAPADLERLQRLTARVTYDDGYVLYLNGVRVAAVNLEGNPPAFDRPANSSTDYVPETHDLTSRLGLLRPGVNVLAIQGHNGLLSGSSDFVLAPELLATWAPPAAAEPALRRVVLNEFQANSEGDTDWVELFNPSDAAVDLTGVWLSDQAETLNRYAFPTGSTIPAHGFLTLTQAQFGFGLSAGGEALFLTAPGQDFVIDAYAFGAQARGASLGRFPDGGADWYALEPPSAGAPNQPGRRRTVLINELMYHAPAGAPDDFVELYNAGTAAVDLSGWRFEGVAFTFPDGFTLPPGGFVVLADDPASAAATYGVPEPAWFRYRDSLSNAGERVTLLDADDVVVDTVAYRDQAPWPVTPDGLGASLERSCSSAAFDAPEDWRASPLGAPTPLARNHVLDCEAPPLAPVVINEIMYHPLTDTDDERRTEFIELYHHGDTVLDLTGWGLTGDIRCQFPPGLQLAPGAYLLVAWDPARVAAFYQLDPTRVIGPYRPGLGNGGGRIVLFGADGRTVDAVRYDDDFPWPSAADGHGRVPGAGHSLERRSPTGPSADPANWEASVEDQPTPLQPNHRSTAEPPPTAVALAVTPHPVTAADSPTVSVTLAGVNDADEIRIEYWVDDPETENEPRSAQPMTLLTPNGETVAGHPVWQAVLPALPANTLVRYRVAWRHAATWEVVSPRPGTDVYAWHAYFVDPEVATPLPGGVCHLFLSAANWRRLHDATAAGRVAGNQPNPTWNLEVSAVFVGDGVVHDVQVRHQGSRWNRNGGSTISFACASHRPDGQAQLRSWRIAFPSHRNHRGMDVLLLQKQSGWPQRVSFEMFRMAGVPVPRTGWTRLQINGCPFNDAAFAIERPGTDLVARWFTEVGDLFKSEGFIGDEGPWSWGDERLIQGTSNGFTQTQRYKHTYDRTTLGWKNDPLSPTPDLVEPLIQQLHTARAAGPPALRAFLAEHFDLDLTLRYLATINYVGTFDDMFQNHFLYRQAENGKWCLFPWDMDNTLGGAFGEATAHPFRGADESRIGPVGNREGWWNRLKDSFFIAYPDEFQALFHYLNNHVYSPAQMQPVVEALAAERGYGAGTVSSLMTHLQRRHDYLNATLVAPVVPPALTVRRVGPETLECSWPFAAFGFSLESAPQPGGPWQAAREPVTSGPHTHTARVRPLGERRFFRLAR